MSSSTLTEFMIREKKFDLRKASSRFVHHTMTDDHTLFMLHQNRDRIERGEAPIRKHWLQRVFNK